LNGFSYFFLSYNKKNKLNRAYELVCFFELVEVDNIILKQIPHHSTPI